MKKRKRGIRDKTRGRNGEEEQETVKKGREE